MINFKREVGNINKLDMINNYEFVKELPYEEILSYYAYSVKIMESKSESFLKNNNIYNYVLKEDGENNDVVNCAAIILMYEGKFQQAFELFGFNYKVNKDKVSKEYIHKLDEFNEFIFRYNSVLDLVKIEAYDAAIEILREYNIKKWRTEKSDLLLALLYYHKKNYFKCRRVLNSLHKPYKDSIIYHMIYEELTSIKKKRLGISTAIIIMIAALGSFYIFKGNIKAAKKNEIKKNEINIEKVVKKQPVVEENIAKETKPITIHKKKLYINYTEALKKLEKHVTKDDFESFREINGNIIYADLNLEQKKRYDKLLKRYKRAAQPYYYYEGKRYTNQRKYDKAVESLIAAYKCKMNRSLDEHVLFSLAQSLKLKNDSRASHYYKEYLRTYKKGIYTHQVQKQMGDS